MSKIKIGFSSFTVPQQVERSRLITTAMTGNINFATPVPTLADVIASTNALETAYNESRGRDKNKVEIMRLRRIDMLALIVQLAAYVQSTSNGEKEKILSSGFDVISRGGPQPPVGKVLNLRVSNSRTPGTMRLLWDRMPGAKLYIIGVSDDPFSETSFEVKATSTKIRYRITDLTPGKKYWFKVAAIGKDGEGAYSDPAGQIAQ